MEQDLTPPPNITLLISFLLHMRSTVSSYPTPTPTPKKYLSLWNPAKYLNSKFERLKMAQGYVYMEESEYPPPTPRLTPSSPDLWSVVDFYLGGIIKLWTKNFDSTDERYYIHHMTGQVCSVIVQRKFYPLHRRYIFVLSFIHRLLTRQSSLVDRSLSITCPLDMRYSCVLCAPYTFREDPYRHRDDLSPDEHRINNFCIFSVR